ncbi:MAG: ABC transporter permease [Alphaproteobacteria bacterium]
MKPERPPGGGRWRRFRALVVKETIQIFRDPSSVLIAFVLPLILLFLFGYGVSLDSTKINIGLVLEDTSSPARNLASGFVNSRFFSTKVVHDRRDLEEDLVKGRVRGIIVIPVGLAARPGRAQAPAQMQIITDGTQPNTASFVQNYARGIWKTWQRQVGTKFATATKPAIALEGRVWFNEELISRNFLVPGTVAVIMTLIGTLLTALVVAREWERGTMEAMIATPLGRFELLAGKIVPYFALGLVSMLVCTFIAVTLFGVPLRGSLAALTLVSAVFLFPALGQGYLISAVTKNQFVASQIALFSGFLPAMLLSGFIFEIASMPPVVRALTTILPVRYFVSSLQTLFLAGDIWSVLLPAMAVMLAIGAVFFGLAIRATANRLD